MACERRLADRVCGNSHVLALGSVDRVTVMGEPGVEDGWQHWMLSSAPQIREGI
ncbi:hypothetical protein [Nocardia sp. SC052]|uniref:hypothetical protein n=1 Tax=Nocardia sichangensis TaxID=3385975 RepID=UPI0039A2919C